MHGGKSPRGISSPSFKHGRYSKDLPTDLLELFEESLYDTELLEMEREVALIGSRIAQLLRSLNEESSATVCEDAVYAFRAYKRAKLKRDKPAAEDAFQRLEEILEKQKEQTRTWDEIKELVSLRRQLSGSQTKREERLGRWVETHKVAVLLSALTDALKNEIRDPLLLNRIGTKFNEIVAQHQAKPLLGNQTLEGANREAT